MMKIFRMNNKLLSQEVKLLQISNIYQTRMTISMNNFKNSSLIAKMKFPFTIRKVRIEILTICLRKIKINILVFKIK